MTAALAEPDVRGTGTDQVVQHVHCCGPTLALCGEQLDPNDPEAAEGTPDCRLCVLAEESGWGCAASRCPAWPRERS